MLDATRAGPDELRAAIGAGQFVAAYQPIVDLRTGRTVGAEALARWRSPERGYLSPNGFAAAFDDPELETAISDAVLDQAIWEAARLRSLGAARRTAVNATLEQLLRADFSESVLRDLAAAGAAPPDLTIEVTERIPLSTHREAIAACLRALRDAGVSVAFDDFGTGFATLMHLKDFPLDAIKIDRMFVGDLARRSADRAVVRGVIAMAHELDISVTAEGVEDAETADTLREMGCDRAQGLFYGAPALVAEDD